MLKNVLLSSLIFNLGLLLGRLSGFVRESFLAANFGTGFYADVAVLMLTLPDLLVNILIGGALAAALIPEFSRRADMKQLLLGQALLVMLIAFSVLCLLLTVFIELFLSLFAPGFEDSLVVFASAPVSLVMWLIPLTVLGGVYTAYLQFQDHFAVPALGTLMINLVIVAGLIIIGVLSPKDPLSVLAVTVLLGGGVRLSALVVTGWRLSGWPVFAWQPWLISWDLLKKFLQVAGAGCLLLCFPVVIRAFASYAGEGSVAQVSYALKLVELPLALAVTFLGVVLYPRLSRAYENDSEQFVMVVLWGLRATILLAMLAVASMLPIANWLVDVVYGYGKMKTEALSRVTEYFSIAVFYIPFMGLATFVAASLNARGGMFTPFWINGVGFVVLMITMFWLPEGKIKWQLMALVGSYALLSLLSLTVLLMRMPRLLQMLFSMPSIVLTMVVVITVYLGVGLLADM